jgi:hypothetical protein
MNNKRRSKKRQRFLLSLELVPSSLPQPITTTQKREALGETEVAIVAVLADGEGGVEASSIDRHPLEQ